MDEGQVSAETMPGSPTERANNWLDGWKGLAVDGLVAANVVINAISLNPHLVDHGAPKVIFNGVMIAAGAVYAGVQLARGAQGLKGS